MPLNCLMCLTIMSMTSYCHTGSACPKKQVPICRTKVCVALCTYMYNSLSTQVCAKIHQRNCLNQLGRKLKQATAHPLEGGEALCECIVFLEDVQRCTDECCLGSCAEATWSCDVIIMTSSNESVCSRRVTCQGI